MKLPSGRDLDGDFMQAALTTGPIRKLLLQIAVPMSVGLFFNTMFNVVDTIYAGRLGTTSLAGMSASFSVFFILTAFVSGIGTGLAALLSNAIGRQDQKAIDHLTVNGLALTVVVSLILTIAGLLFSPLLMMALGSRGQALEEGSRYVRAIYAGALFFGLNATFNAFLSAHGQTKPYRNFLIIGFLLNLILDPLFIFGWLGLPRMGTFGVALATVIVQLAGNFYLAWKVRDLLNFKFAAIPYKKISLKHQLEILGQGLPAAMNMLTIAIGIFVISYFIYQYGDDAGIAGYGAAIRLEQIALLPALGLNTATLNMVGQNFGAAKFKRVREIYFTAMKIGIAMMSVGMVLIYLFAPHLIGIFNQDPQVIREGSRYLRIDFIAFNGYVIINVCLSLLQGLKKPHYAIWIGIYRQLAMPLLLFYLLGTVMKMGLPGVWWGIVITVWTGAAGMLIMAGREMRCLKVASEE